MLTTLALILAAAAPPGDDAAVPTARELENRVIAYRQSLERGHVTFVVRNPRNRGNPDQEKVTREYEMHFDGMKVRSILRESTPKWQHTRRAIFTGTSYISDMTDRMAIDAGPATERTSLVGSVFDPRLLGLATAEVAALYTTELKSVFAYLQADRSPTVTRDAVDGEMAWRAEYHPRPGSRVRFWVVPRFGDGLARIETEDEDAPTKTVSRWLCASAFGQSGGYWFPRRVLTRQDVNGEARIEQKVDVTTAEFQLPIDPKVFGFDGLDMVAGRQVHNGGRAMVWDGKNLISERLAPPDLAPIEPPAPKTTPWVWWSLAILASLAAVSLIVFAFRRFR